MIEEGFEEVYHLQGGILKYLEEVPKAQSRWQGECFVFDDRVAVNHELARGQYDQCFACRHPITAEDQRSEKYQQGISCPALLFGVDRRQKSTILGTSKTNRAGQAARGQASRINSLKSLVYVCFVKLIIAIFNRGFGSKRPLLTLNSNSLSFLRAEITPIIRIVDPSCTSTGPPDKPCWLSQRLLLH